MNLKEKLSLIQSKLRAPKEKNNSFGGFQYRTCEDILENLKPYLSESKTIVRFRDEITLVGDRFYVQSHAILEDCDSNDFIESVAWAREAKEKRGMDDSQVTGSATSYARKNALGGLFAIDNNKDPDDESNYSNDFNEPPKAEASKKEEAKKEGAKTESKATSRYSTEELNERSSMLKQLCFQQGDDYPQKLCSAKGVQSIEEVPTGYIKKAWDAYCKGGTK